MHRIPIFRVIRVWSHNAGIRISRDEGLSGVNLVHSKPTVIIMLEVSILEMCRSQDSKLNQSIHIIVKTLKATVICISTCHPQLECWSIGIGNEIIGTKLFVISKLNNTRNGLVEIQHYLIIGRYVIQFSFERRMFTLTKIGRV